MNDDQLIERLRGVERDVALDAEAEQRVFDRMMRAHISEVATASDVQGSDHTAHVFELHPSDGARPDEQRPAFGRRSVVLARVALIMVAAVGLIGVVLATTTGDDSAPAVSDGSPLRSAPTSTPVTSSQDELAGLGNVFGFRPFTTYNYVDEQTTGSVVSSSPMTIRVGELTDAGTASVRRLVVGATGDDRIAVDVASSGAAAVVVPAEFIDPTLFGGTCTGGAIALSRTAASAVSAATCRGVQDVELDVSSTLGGTERLVLDTVGAVDAVPLSITIQPANASSARTVTLWFSDGGVVRWSFPTPSGIADYDISSESAERLG